MGPPEQERWKVSFAVSLAVSHAVSHFDSVLWASCALCCLYMGMLGCRDDGSYGPIPSRRPLGMLGMPFNRTSVQVQALPSTAAHPLMARLCTMVACAYLHLVCNINLCCCLLPAKSPTGSDDAVGNANNVQA